MFKNYTLVAVAMLLLSVLSVASYYYFKSEKQGVDIENNKVQLEVVKEEAKTEVLETKWETIAKEYNKTRGDKKNEIKEPVTNYDVNTTDFYFFGMFPNG